MSNLVYLNTYRAVPYIPDESLVVGAMGELRLLAHALDRASLARVVRSLDRRAKTALLRGRVAESLLFAACRTLILQEREVTPHASVGA